MCLHIFDQPILKFSNYRGFLQTNRNNIFSGDNNANWHRSVKDRIPVSYTHLDVYKRQPLSCWTNRLTTSMLTPLNGWKIF